ncbi:hypothetical protein F0L17_00810 [Streptomyces sp. TRM43335]|uniref:Uncharacterized protein n=1 Tax=Streptomyces taklimakanensis TaxID=2569853 RepID=A0A6G2B644_9ACTN|nr:hypothetical protein [Streptomyces taklimakanensis]
MPHSELMPIGVFARRTGLTSSALRFHADLSSLPGTRSRHPLDLRQPPKKFGENRGRTSSLVPRPQPGDGLVAQASGTGGHGLGHSLVPVPGHLVETGAVPAAYSGAGEETGNGHQRTCPATAVKSGQHGDPPATVPCPIHRGLDQNPQQGVTDPDGQRGGGTAVGGPPASEVEAGLERTTAVAGERAVSPELPLRRERSGPVPAVQGDLAVRLRLRTTGGEAQPGAAGAAPLHDLHPHLREVHPGGSLALLPVPRPGLTGGLVPVLVPHHLVPGTGSEMASRGVPDVGDGLALEVEDPVLRVQFLQQSVEGGDHFLHPSAGQRLERDGMAQGGHGASLPQGRPAAPRRSCRGRSELVPYVGVVSWGCLTVWSPGTPPRPPSTPPSRRRWRASPHRS